MKKIGILQGRLLPRYKKRYQAHPVDYWQSEFYIAKEMGFSYIEFILDFNNVAQNPIMSKKGIKEIKKLIKQTGVKVNSICADYFMEAPFHSKAQKQSEKILKKLLKNASKLDVIDVVIPCVDQSSLKTKKDKKMFISSVKKALPYAKKYNININFESDLNPKEFKELLSNFDSKNIKVNYDIGNSSSLGYNPKEEFEAYGQYISDLHIKDRILNGGSVELGTGDADFDTIFKLLKKYKFKGNIIMQSAKADDYIDDLKLVEKQKVFISKYISKFKI